MVSLQGTHCRRLGMGLCSRGFAKVTSSRGLGIGHVPSNPFRCETGKLCGIIDVPAHDGAEKSRWWGISRAGMHESNMFSLRSGCLVQQGKLVGSKIWNGAWCMPRNRDAPKVCCVSCANQDGVLAQVRKGEPFGSKRVSTPKVSEGGNVQ